MAALVLATAPGCGEDRGDGGAGPAGTSVQGERADEDRSRGRSREREAGDRRRRGDERILPPGSKFKGLTYGEWGARWWQWITPQALDENPMTDATGEDCANHPPRGA